MPNVTLFKNSINGEEVQTPVVYISLSQLQEGTDYKVWTDTRSQDETECNVIGLQIYNGVACAQAIQQALVAPDAPNQLIPQVKWKVEERFDATYEGNIYFGYLDAGFEGEYSNLQPSDWPSKWRTKYYKEVTYPNLTRYPATIGGAPYRSRFYIPFTNSSTSLSGVPDIPTWTGRGSYDQTGLYSYDNSKQNTLQVQYFLSNGNTFGVFRTALPSGLTSPDGVYDQYKIITGAFGDHLAAYNMTGEQNKFAARIYGLAGERVDPWRYGLGFDQYYPGVSNLGYPSFPWHSVLEESVSQTYLGMGYIEYNDKKYMGPLIVQFSEEDGTMVYATFNGWEESPFWDKVLQPELPPINWNVPENTSRGGDGAFDYISNATEKTNGENTTTNISLNSFTSMGDAGFTWALFNKANFEKVCKKLRTRTEIGKLLEDGNVINPFEVIKSVHMIPTSTKAVSDYSVERTHLNVAGWLDMDVNYRELTNRRWFYNFGTKRIEGPSKSFLDYPPYTSAKLYLPFIGERAIDVSTFMDGSIEIDYCIDVYTGDCLARVYCTNAKGDITENDFSGNCAWRLPFQTGDTSQAMLSSAVSNGKDIVQGLATKNAQQTITGALSAARDIATTAISGHTTWNNVTGNSSVMGGLGILLEIYYPKLSMPMYYNRLHGYRSDLGGFGGEVFNANGTGFVRLSGMTVFRDTELWDIPDATKGEMDELRELMETGIILPGQIT